MASQGGGKAAGEKVELNPNLQQSRSFSGVSHPLLPPRPAGGSSAPSFQFLHLSSVMLGYWCREGRHTTRRYKCSRVSPQQWEMPPKKPTKTQRFFFAFGGFLDPDKYSLQRITLKGSRRQTAPSVVKTDRVLPAACREARTTPTVALRMEASHEL